jgi:hypothetical protein
MVGSKCGAKKGVFSVVIEFMGYRSVTINNVSITNDDRSVDLKTIALASSSKDLKEIKIIGHQRLKIR